MQSNWSKHECRQLTRGRRALSGSMIRLLWSLLSQRDRSFSTFERRPILQAERAGMLVIFRTAFLCSRHRPKAGLLCFDQGAKRR